MIRRSLTTAVAFAALTLLAGCGGGDVDDDQAQASGVTDVAAQGTGGLGGSGLTANGTGGIGGSGKTSQGGVGGIGGTGSH